MEPKGSWKRGYELGYAKSVFDLRDAANLLRRVKLWRDSPGNECFPADLRDDIETYLSGDH